MPQKKTFLVFGSAFVLQIVAYILLDRTFPEGARAIVTVLVSALLHAPESLVNNLHFSTDSFLWSIMPWFGGGLIGGLAARDPKKGAASAILAIVVALALFIVVYLFLEGIGLSPLLNTHGRTMVVGSLFAALLAIIAGVLGGTLTQS